MWDPGASSAWSEGASPTHGLQGPGPRQAGGCGRLGQRGGHPAPGRRTAGTAGRYLSEPACGRGGGWAGGSASRTPCTRSLPGGPASGASLRGGGRVGERKTRLVRLTRRDRTCPRAPGDAVGLPPGSADGPGTRTAVSERRSQRIEARPCDSPAARPCCSRSGRWQVCGLRVAGRSAGRCGPRQRHGRQIEWHGVAAPGTGTRSQQGRATDTHPPGPCCGPHAVPRGQEGTPGNEPYSVHRPHVASANPLGFAGKRMPTPWACLPASRSRPPRRRPRFTGGAPSPPPPPRDGRVHSNATQRTNGKHNTEETRQGP